MMLQLLFTILTIFTCISFSMPQNIPIMTFRDFEPKLYPSNDSVYVINFWATWCKPCIEELPALLQAHRTYKDHRLRLLLISLDFKSQYEKKLIPFIKDNNIDADVILLDAPNYNEWIPRVNKKWNGSIPATLIVHAPTKTRYFFERPINFDELDQIIKPLIKRQ